MPYPRSFAGRVARVLLIAGLVLLRVILEVYGDSPGLAQFLLVVLIGMLVWWAVVEFAKHPKRIRQHRIDAGLCPECGYDMRATPARCPECGCVVMNAAKE